MTQSGHVPIHPGRLIRRALLDIPAVKSSILENNSPQHRIKAAAHNVANSKQQQCD
jgi:hypothetical protein